MSQSTRQHGHSDNNWAPRTLNIDLIINYLYECSILLRNRLNIINDNIMLYTIKYKLNTGDDMQIIMNSLNMLE